MIDGISKGLKRYSKEEIPFVILEDLPKYKMKLIWVEIYIRG